MSYGDICCGLFAAIYYQQTQTRQVNVARPSEQPQVADILCLAALTDDGYKHNQDM